MSQNRKPVKKTATKVRKTALPLPQAEADLEPRMGQKVNENLEQSLGLMRAKLTKSYQMMLDLMQYLGPVPLVFKAYDNWFVHDLPKFLREEKIQLKGKGKNHFISLEYEGFTKPEYRNSKGQVRALMPRIAKLENHDYAAQIYVNIELWERIEKEDGEYENVLEDSKKKVPFFQMPVMVNSSLCHLRDMSPEEKLMVGTDPDDPGGYFILVPTLKQTNSEPRQAKEVFFVNKDSMIKDVSSHIFIEAGNPVAKTTISTNYGTQQITVIRDGKTNILNARVALKEKQTVNVLVIFKILHEIEKPDEDFNLEETVDMIVSMSKPQWANRLKITLSSTIEHFNAINNHTLYFAERMGVGNVATRDEEVHNHIKKVVFPTSPIKYRTTELAILMIRLLEFMIKERDLDDRDHWGNKRIDTAGSLIGTLFNTLFIRVRRDIADAMNTRVVNINHVETVCMESFTKNLTNEFHMSFTGAKWGPSGSYRSNANYLEPLPTNGTLTTVLSLLTGVKKPTKNKVDPSVRQVKGSSYGYIDPGDSPEGKVIGIKLFMSILAMVSLNRNMDVLKDYLYGKIKAGGKDISVRDERNEVHKDKVVLNGIFMGWGSGYFMEKELRKMKRLNQIPYDTRIYYEPDDDMLYLDLNGGRTIRPLLVVEDDGKLTMDKKNLWNSPMSTIVEAGAIEWVDPQEARKMTVAYSIDFFHKRKNFLRDLEDQLDSIKKNSFKGDKIANYKGYFDISDENERGKTINSLKEVIQKEAYEANYHYCEIDANGVFGYAGALVPFANSNPVPRITLQSNMGRQVIGRVSKVQHLLYNRSTMEITPTASFEYMGLEDYIGQSSHSPNQTAFMAVVPRRQNQEDATELNGSSVQRGLFNFTEYYSSVVSEVCTNETTKKIGTPDMTKVSENKRKHYRNVDDRGIVKIDSIVNEGDVLVSAWKQNTVNRAERKEFPLVVRKGEGGTVDSVYITQDPSGARTVSVKVRQERVPIVGDKFQMGAAQKGVVGAITPEVDLPFVVGGNPDMMGMRPDIIINAHAFPSRMTIGAFLEMISSLVGIKTGTAMDVSAFQEELTMDSMLKALKRLGVINKGYVQLASGTSGKILRDVHHEGGAQMFMLPIVYRQLKHVTHNKMQARGTGAKKIDTGQPVGGRQREGATRFGRMESDVVASHGAFSFLSDRLCKSSDAFESVVCSTCGHFAAVDVLNQRFKCTICETEHENEGFSKVILPYIGINIAHQLASAGIKMKMHVQKNEGQMIFGGYEDITI